MLMDHSEGGVNYSILAKAIERVAHGTTLSELVNLVYNKVACEGEIANLKFICRFPKSQTRVVINYIALLIIDDSTLETVLDIPSFFLL